MSDAEWDRALAEAKSGPPVDEAAFREELAARAQDIAAKITRGEIAHGLPAGCRFEFTRAKGPHPIDAAFTAQVRGTAPEPTPDGFLVPPGMTDWLSAYFDEHMPAALAFLGQPGEPDDGSTELLIPRKLASHIQVPDELLMDMGVIPDTRPPLPPPSWRTRLRWKAGAWREHAARRAYRIVAGYWPDDGEDDW